MFVCICQGVTLSGVRAAVESGAATLDAVEAACGAGGDCGTCRADLDCIIRDLRMAAAKPEAA
jgi:bacterioferritin-associated ferredoxin